MGVDRQLLTAVIFLRHCLIRAFARDVARVFDVRKLIAPLIRLRRTSQQGCARRQ